MGGVSIVSLAFCALLGYFVVLYRREIAEAPRKACSFAKQIVCSRQPHSDPRSSAAEPPEKSNPSIRPGSAHELVAHLERLQHAGTACSLMCLSVDSFREVRKRYGPAARDKVLEQLTGVLRELLSEAGVFVQAEGDGLNVLLPKVTLDRAEQAARQALDRVGETRFVFQGRDIPVQVNLGLAEGKRGEPPKTLIGRAEAALEAAQESGPQRAYLHNGQRSRSLRPILRHNQRYSVDRYQRISPYLGQTWSPKQLDQEVLCMDLSAGGFAFLARQRPEYTRLVVELGAGEERKYLLAQVKSCVRTGPASEGLFRVGCMFAGRMQQNEDGTWTCRASGEDDTADERCGINNPPAATA